MDARCIKHLREEQLVYLRENNEGTIVELECIHPYNEKQFDRVFIMLHAQANATVHCKSILSFDACFLKNKQWGNYRLLVCGKLSY